MATTTGSVSFGGLSSGLDTKGIIDSLVGVKQTQLLQPLTNRISQLKTQATVMQPIITKFNELRDVAKALKDTANTAYNVKNASSSDTDKVIIGSTSSSKALVGTYNVTEVTQLAQVDRVIFQGLAHKDQDLGAGTFSFTYNGATTNVSISPGNGTLEDIAREINDAQTGMTASIINDGSSDPYRLVLTGNHTGADYSLSGLSVTIAGLTNDAALSNADENQAADAAFKVNGITMANSSNTVTEGIPGVAFTLLNTTAVDETITINVKQNTGAIAKNITDFVDSFTQLRKSLGVLLLPDENGQLSPVAQDTTLQNAFVRISSIMGKVMNGLSGYDYKTLSQIGITGDGKGNMDIDSAALSTAIQTNLTNVQKIFQGTSTEDGIAESMYTYMDNLTNAGGIFAAKDKIAKDTNKFLSDEIIRNQNYIVEYQNSLSLRFQRLEQTLNRLKGQGNAIDSLAGVYSGSSNRLL